MGSKSEDAKALMKQIIKQIGGDVNPDTPLIPEYCIKGKGEIFCYDPSQRIFVKVSRGISAYVVYEYYDTQGRSLIYTVFGDMVCIDPEELYLLGLD
jgi:hypothetical protein